MKNKIIFLLLWIAAGTVHVVIGQNIVTYTKESDYTNTKESNYTNRNSQVAVDEKNVQSFKIPYEKTTHIISPEPILYVDISSPYVLGDLPEKHIFRLKPNINTANPLHSINQDENFTVTIVTETFVTVYKLSFNDKNSLDQSTAYVLTIDPVKSIQLNNYNKLSHQDYDRLAYRAMSNKRKIFNVHTKENGMELWLNNIYVIGDLMLFDLGAKNHTNVQYNINDVDFKLTDKYSVSATVSQEIDIKPIYQFSKDVNSVIENKWHNYYIFRKFTYPSQKTLEIKMSENQISGRPISIQVDYNQILESKNLIN